MLKKKRTRLTKAQITKLEVDDKTGRPILSLKENESVEIEIDANKQFVLEPQDDEQLVRLKGKDIQFTPSGKLLLVDVGQQVGAAPLSNFIINVEPKFSDLRNFGRLNIKNIDVIIHLANVANDPTVELNPTLSWEINVLASKIIADHAIKNKVKKIIFLSSGSVYGVKKENKVIEELQLNPISTYNKTKMVSERVFLSYAKSRRKFGSEPIPTVISRFAKEIPDKLIDISMNIKNTFSQKKSYSDSNSLSSISTSSTNSASST